MVALHEDLPSEHQMVSDMKRGGTFDELRTTYRNIIEQNTAFKSKTRFDP